MRGILLGFSLVCGLHAAVVAHVGQFVQGTTAVTDVGFRPQVLLFFSTLQTADGSAADFQIGIGMATSSTARVAEWTTVTNADSTAKRRAITTGAIVIDNTAQTTVGQADLVSMDARGFTLSWSVNDSTARIIKYVALAGFTAVKVGTWSTCNSATGNLAVTGVGFQPDALIPMLFTSAPGAGANSDFALAFITAAAQMAVAGQTANAGVSNRRERALAWELFFSSSGNLYNEATFTSFDVDGFTINDATCAGSSLTAVYLALKGGSIAVGTTTQPTSNGSVSVTGLGFKPSVVLLMGDETATSVVTVANQRFAIGAATSSTSRWAQAAGRTSSANNASVNVDSAKVIEFITENGATPVVVSAADLTSMDVGGFTLNWTTTDATARLVAYLAIGPAPSGAVRHRVTQ